MSLCLALETATEFASVALGDGQDLLAEVIVGRRKSAAVLVPSIESCLQLAGAAWEDIDTVAIADGPGSFTGVRIGFATAQGILAERELEVSVTPSLMVLAWGVAQSDPAPVATLYDALRGDVFAAVYSFSRDAVTVHVAPVLTTVAAVKQRCSVRPRVAAGDGATAFADEVRAWTGAEPLGFPQGAPRASALIGVRRLRGGTLRMDSLEHFEPSYGRVARAQAAWESEHGTPMEL